MKMFFKEWLSQFANDNNYIGDFARDVAQDGNFPSENSLKALKAYFQWDDDILEIVKELWPKYLKDMRD